MFKPGYKRFIETYFDIVDKDSHLVPFRLNAIQDKFLLDSADNKRDVILKARQQGFSSVILACFTTDFLLKDNSRSVIVADESENAIELLDRVRQYIESYETKAKVKIPMKYDSKYELYNEAKKSRYSIGTAMRTEFGRSKTISNLHLSECAFYPDMERMLAGALQAVSTSGRVVLETTANGFNYFRDFWMESERGTTNFTPHFYKASDFYDVEFLRQKQLELRSKFRQEYPENPIEAFISSGDNFFDSEALEYFITNALSPRTFAYADQI